MLRHLQEHPYRLITKQELFHAVWADTYVTDGVLKNCISEIRHVLQDSAAMPRYIETMPRRGYRCIATVTTQPVVSSQQPVASSGELSGVRSPASKILNPQSAFRNPQSAMTLVGREAELAQLHSRLGKALNGERQFVFVTGEPGIGKTALVEAFLHGLEMRSQSAEYKVTGSLEESQNAKVKSQKSKIPEAQSSALSPQSLSLPNPQSQIPNPAPLDWAGPMYRALWLW